MARVPYVDLATAPARVRETLAGSAAPANLLRMLAHAESNLRSLLRLGGTILSKQLLSPRIRELAILRVAQLSRAQYEWVQHVPLARAAGLSVAQIAAVEAGSVSADCFDARDRLVLRFTSEVVADVRAADATFDELAHEFTAREVVELTLVIGYYMMMARLLETLGVDLEPEARAKLIDAMR